MILTTIALICDVTTVVITVTEPNLLDAFTIVAEDFIGFTVVLDHCNDK